MTVTQRDDDVLKPSNIGIPILLNRLNKPFSALAGSLNDGSTVRLEHLRRAMDPSGWQSLGEAFCHKVIGGGYSFAQVLTEVRCSTLSYTFHIDRVFLLVFWDDDSVARFQCSVPSILQLFSSDEPSTFGESTLKDNMLVEGKLTEAFEAARLNFRYSDPSTVESTRR